MRAAQTRDDVLITSGLVAALIREQFPQWSERVVVPVEPGGWDNRTFRLGDDLLVRLPSHARYVPGEQGAPLAARAGAAVTAARAHSGRSGRARQRLSLALVRLSLAGWRRSFPSERR